MDIFRILEELEEYIQGCKHVPMTGKLLMGEDELLDFIDRIRSLLPEEIHQARLMVKDRERLMEEARAESDRVLTQANQRIEGMISQSEMVRQAQATAEEIVAQGKRVAYEIKNNAALYADDIMSSLETNLEQNLELIHRGRGELNQMKKISV